MVKKIHRIIFIIFLGVFLFLLPGCYDMRELDQNAFVLAVGLDTAKTNPNYVKVTVMIAIPKDIAGTGGGDGGGGADEGLLITSIEAPKLPTAINLINTYVGRELNFKQAAFVFLGEDLAKTQGVFKRNFLLRYYEIRRSSRLFIVRGEAAEIINLIKPKLSKNPSKYLSSMVTTTKYSGFIPEETLHSFNVDVENPNINGVLPLCGVNHKAEEKEIRNGKAITYEDYLPGEIDRIGGIPIEFIGSALFKKDKMIGEIDGTETRFLNMIKGDFHTGFFSIPEIGGKQELTSIKIIQTQSPSIKIIMNDNQPKIKIQINVEGEIVSSGKTTDYSKKANIEKFEGTVEENLKSRGEKFIKKLQELNTDPLDLGNHIAGEFLTYQDLRNYGWLEKGKFKNADIKLDFRIQIRRVGYQLGPTE